MNIRGWFCISLCRLETLILPIIIQHQLTSQMTSWKHHIDVEEEVHVYLSMHVWKDEYSNWFPFHCNCQYARNRCDVNLFWQTLCLLQGVLVVAEARQYSFACSLHPLNFNFIEADCRFCSFSISLELTVSTKSWISSVVLSQSLWYFTTSCIARPRSILVAFVQIKTRTGGKLI